jgi:hypothetical protein
MQPITIQKSAVISACCLYRYELRRTWDDTLPPYVSGMLNPSIADNVIDDATIVRNVRRAAALGFGSLIVWNLGAGRATDPAEWKAMPDPIGPENDDYVERILIECRERKGVAVVGWGTHGSFQDRDEIAIGIASRVGVALQCLGTTKDGHPRHPLYVARAQQLMPWRRG